MSNTQDLKNIGLKVTFPRLKILDLFRNGGARHLSAEDIHQLLITEGIEVGLATIYRALAQFEQAGLLTRHFFDSGRAVFELDQGRHHDHLVCLQCGKVEEFYDPEIERRQAQIAKERGYLIVDHALNLYVECSDPHCKNKKPA